MSILEKDESGRVFYYDFVRTVAFIIIIIYHFNVSIESRYLSDFSIISNSYANVRLDHIGVPLFFILSGASLMNNNYTRVSEYYLKRARAIFPLFWLSWAIVAMWYFFRYKTLHPFTIPPRKWTFILTVLGMDGYTASFMNNYYLVGEWFLGCILIMYLIFPLLRRALLAYPGMLCISVLFLYCISIYYYCFPTEITQNALCRLPEFVFGMFIGRYGNKRIPCSVFIVSILIMSVMTMLPLMFFHQMIKITLIGICSFLIVAFVGQHIYSIGLQRLIVLVSKYTYPVYLLHHVISEQIISTFEGRCDYSPEEIITLLSMCLVMDFCGGVLLLRVMRSIQSLFHSLGNKNP